jgi:hypothetical protein
MTMCNTFLKKASCWIANAVVVQVLLDKYVATLPYSFTAPPSLPPSPQVLKKLRLQMDRLYCVGMRHLAL